MDGVLLLIAIILGISVLDLLADRFGVDSRYESSDSRSQALGLS